MEDNLEQKIESVLGNPDLMQKIITMANSMSESGNQPKDTPTPAAMPDPSVLTMVRQLSGFTEQASIDAQQKALLAALSPYLSRNRLQKLENAMKAAKMTQIATSLMNRSGFPFRSDR